MQGQDSDFQSMSLNWYEDETQADSLDPIERATG